MRLVRTCLSKKSAVGCTYCVKKEAVNGKGDSKGDSIEARERFPDRNTRGGGVEFSAIALLHARFNLYAL